ncbi:MAG: TIGR02757 family protein [Nitrospirae bacterium]|nr:TIGR02757 family protein [Nitrospirota bacterium]
MPELKKVLDRFYREYDFAGRIMNDPIEFPRRYNDPRDIEVTGFISSALAYGKVQLFRAVLEKIFSVMGVGPCDFILGTDPRKLRRLLRGLKYRFNENDDIICLIHILKEVLLRHGSLEELFMKYYRDEDLNVGQGLSGFMDELTNVDTSVVYGSNLHPPGLMQFFASPRNGSACKRANLYLRWMIRDRDIDLGIWKRVPKNRLVIPLDTHIARISRCLGLSARKSPDWKMAVEITGALRRFDPEDPLKYDFALCHHGISGACKGQKKAEACKKCVFNL